MVGGETDAVSAFCPTQLLLGKPCLEGDASFSKELDDLGSGHVVSIDATCSTDDRLTRRVVLLSCSEGEHHWYAFVALGKRVTSRRLDEVGDGLPGHGGVFVEGFDLKPRR